MMDRKQRLLCAEGIMVQIYLITETLFETQDSELKSLKCSLQRRVLPLIRVLYSMCCKSESLSTATAYTGGKTDALSG